MDNYSSLSNDDLIKLFNKLDHEFVKRSKSYEMFHILSNNRKRRQDNTVADVFYHQILMFYQTDTELSVRFDPVLIRLIKLFDQSKYLIKLVDIPLNKKPKLRTFDDGEYLHEILDLIDSHDIFVPKDLCNDTIKVNDFVDKIEMISWKGIVQTYDNWCDEWIDFLRGKGYHLTNEQQQKNKDNIEIKTKMLYSAILEMNKTMIAELVKLHGDDKQTLCQAIIDIYELMQEKLL